MKIETTNTEQKIPFFDLLYKKKHQGPPKNGNAFELSGGLQTANRVPLEPTKPGGNRPRLHCCAASCSLSCRGFRQRRTGLRVARRCCIPARVAGLRHAPRQHPTAAPHDLRRRTREGALQPELESSTSLLLSPSALPSLPRRRCEPLTSLIPGNRID
jgi:hypothetical protein